MIPAFYINFRSFGSNKWHSVDPLYELIKSVDIGIKLYVYVKFI